MMAHVFGERSQFYFEEGFTFLNHGSFGAVPRTVYEERSKLLLEQESNPDSWFRYKYQSRLLSGLNLLSQMLNCEPDELVFVENATTGVTTALRSNVLSPSDNVLVTTLSYSAIRAAAEDHCRRVGATCYCLDLTLPIKSRNEVIEKYCNFLDAHLDVTFAIVDHITSPSTLLMPVKEITAECHKRNVIVTIDGAHVIGQLALDIHDIGPDYYTSNLHKWFYCPRGCAVLYVSKGMKETVQPLLVSLLHGKGYPVNFFYQATKDYTTYCTVAKAIEFVESCGGQAAISAYISSLMEWAVDMLCKRFGEIGLAAEDMTVPYMASMRLPSALQGEKSKAHCEKLVKLLTHEYKVSILVEPYNDGGELLMRVSANIYNTKDDYERFADVLTDLINHPDKLKS